MNAAHPTTDRVGSRSSTPSQVLKAIVEPWRQGEQPADALQALAQHPELAHDVSAITFLGYEEFCLRERVGDTPDLDEYADRFPIGRDEVYRICSLHLQTRKHFGLDPQDDDAPPLPLEENADDPATPLPDNKLSRLRAGQKFLGFRLHRELGRGSFARVFLAQELNAGDRLVALKISLQGTAEARTLGRCRHPNIVHVNSTAIDETTGFVAVCMEYIDGVSLSDAVAWAFADGRPRHASVFVSEQCPGSDLVDLPYAEGCLRLAVQLADALAHLHATGLVHGDLKPANVTLRADGQPVLIDFNLAFDAKRGRRWVGGTLPYMAPEQLLAMADPVRPGERPLFGASADVYALGVILHEMLTGQHPFGRLPKRGPMDELCAHLLQAQADGALLRPSEVKLDSAVARWIQSCLAQEPGQRPTAAELAEGLRRCLRRSGRAYRWARGHARLVGVTAACALVAILTGTAHSLTEMIRLRQLTPGPVEVVRSDVFGASMRELHRDDADAETLLARARQLLKKGAVEDALRELHRAEVKTTDPRVQAALGYCYNLEPNRKHKLAVQHYRKALEGNLTNAALHNNLAYSYLQRGSLEEAEQHLTLALKMDPKLTAAWHNRALLELRRSYREPAYVPENGVHYAHQAIALGPVTADLTRDAGVLCCLLSERSLDPRIRFESRQAALRHLTEACKLGLDPVLLQNDDLLIALRSEVAFQKLLTADRPEKSPVYSARLLDPFNVD